MAFMHKNKWNSQNTENSSGLWSGWFCGLSVFEFNVCPMSAWYYFHWSRPENNLVCETKFACLQICMLAQIGIPAFQEILFWSASRHTFFICRSTNLQVSNRNQHLFVRINSSIYANIFDSKIYLALGFLVHKTPASSTAISSADQYLVVLEI